MGRSTEKEKKRAKRYYETHPQEREEKIRKQIAKQKANPKKYAKIQRDRYWDDKKYRDYKIAYAKAYYRRKAKSSK